MNPLIHQAVSCPGRLKVRLRFETEDPISEAALLMHDLFRIKAPFVEEVHVLLPLHEIHANLKSFEPAMHDLVENGVIPKDSKLKEFSLQTPTPWVLAYVVTPSVVPSEPALSH